MSRKKHNPKDLKTPELIAGYVGNERFIVRFPPRSLFDKIKIIFDILATVAIYLTLLLSWSQFIAADRKERDASTALAIAQEAGQESEKARVMIEAHEKGLAKLRVSLEQSTAIAEIGDLTFRAENGEKDALLRLRQLGWHPRSNDAPATTRSAAISASRILAKFDSPTYASEGLQRLAASPCPEPVFNFNRIETALTNGCFSDRVQAIGTVQALRLYRLVPRLFEIAVTDQDLNIVQLAANTVNEILDESRGGCTRHSVGNFITNPDMVRRDFETSWSRCSNAVLQVKERRWVSGKDAEGRGIIMPADVTTSQE